MLLAITAMYASSGASSRRRHRADVQALARVLVDRGDAGPHLLFRLQDMCCSVLAGNRQMGEFIARCSVLDRLDEVLHGKTLVTSHESRK